MAKLMGHNYMLLRVVCMYEYEMESTWLLSCITEWTLVSLTCVHRMYVYKS